MRNSNTVFEKHFLLTSGNMTCPNGFCEEQFGALRVLTGRDLHVTRYGKGDTKILLLGDWFDYRNPAFSNEEILENCFTASSFDDFIVNTYPLAGVYIVVWRSGSDIRIFNDMHALKSVFYNYTDGVFNVVSDPQVAADYLGLKPCNNPYYKEARQSITGRIEGCCPGMNTGWQHLYRLSTNHYLDVHKRIEMRFFPNQPLTKLGLSDAVPRISEMLKGYIRAAQLRNNVSFGLTSGWDSRILLSSVESNSDMQCYTLRYPDSSDESEISASLCKVMELSHKSVNCNAELLDKDFYTSIKGVIDSPVKNDIRILEAMKRSGIKGGIDINGITGEELRGRHRRGLRVNTINAISDLMGYPNSSYLQRELENWLETNLELCKKTGIYYIDKLYSDLYYPTVKAKSIRTFEHVVDTMVPYNSRDLFITCNSVSLRHRTPFNPRLMREVVMYNKPELLDIPINPGKNLSQQLLSKVGIYYPAVTIYDAVR